MACDAPYLAGWRKTGAADAGLILFSQVDYCCNNIRLVLLMQTACAHWSVACARVGAVHCVLKPLNWVDTVVEARKTCPLPCLSSLSKTSPTPPATSAVLGSSSGFLPSSCSEVRPLATAVSPRFCWNCKNIPAYSLRRKSRVRHLDLCSFYNSNRRTLWYLFSRFTEGPGRLSFPEGCSLHETLSQSHPCGCCGEPTGPD